MRRDVIAERFFTALISGDRVAARELVDAAMAAHDDSAQTVLLELFWPTIEHIQRLYRSDQLSRLGHNFATRLLRSLAEQMQQRLEPSPRNGKTILLICGDEQGEELGAQICADLLECHGYRVYFAGGGIANDELVAQIGHLRPQALVVFGAVPSTVPLTRLLIDRLHEIGVAPDLQIVVGGGVFNRAEGLPEELGADLWAQGPAELVAEMLGKPQRRMTAGQRTVGRKRRTRPDAA